MRRIAVLVLIFGRVAAAHTAELTADRLTASFDVRPHAVSGPGARLTLADAAALGPMRLVFEIEDGRSGAALDAASGELGAGLTVRQDVSVLEVGEDRALRWRLSFANAGAEQRWLLVRAVIEAESTGPFGFWNGNADYTPAPPRVPPMPPDQCTPLVALSGAGGGLAWGLEPDALMSCYQGAAEPGADGRWRFWFACKLVIDPGQTVELPLVLFGCPATFGYLDAFERYHDLFPAVFALAGRGVDPRATGAGCDYVGWHQGSPELVRRVGGSWDWCMRSWQLPGNWANRPELWREEFGSLERWREIWAEKAGHMATCDFAGMYYIWPDWTDEDLAAERWPEALVDDPLAPRTAWQVKTLACLTFPAGNAYAEQMHADLREVLSRELYAGFGLDSAGSDGRARGPGAQASPGRAWDENGVYCRVNAGTARLMDFIHTLEAPGGYRAACVPNGGDWMVLSRADAILIETSPTQIERHWVDRLNSGEKVMSWWDQFDLSYFVDTDATAPEELRRSIAAMARFIRLRSLQLGGVPMYRQTSGIASIMDDLPEISRIVQAGWQPVPAMKGDADLWFARYGDADAGRSYLIACNPESEPISGPIEVFGEYLGEGGWLLADLSGAALAQTVAGSRTTLDASVPPAMERVFVPVARLNGAGTVAAEVSIDDRLAALTVRIELREVAGTVGVVPLALDGYAPPTLRWNGRDIRSTRLATEPFTAEEPGVLEIVLRSRWFQSDAQALLDFPFIRDGQPACSIVIPEDAMEDEQYAAFRVQEYFRFWYSQPDRDGKPMVEGPMIPIVRGIAPGPQIVLKRDLDLHQFEAEPMPIRVEGDTLTIEHDLGAATRAVYALLGVLDRAHPFRGATPVKFEDERELALYEKAGALGTVIDDREELGM